MFHEEDDKIKVHISNISNDKQEVMSFQSHSGTSDDLEQMYQLLLGKILSGRDIIIVTKGDQLMDLISDAVSPNDKDYIKKNIVKVLSFTLESAAYQIHATLLKNAPLSVAKDLALSFEFMFGNLWFLIPSSDADQNECEKQIYHDICMLAPSAYKKPPILYHEAVALPAMYDGLEILWFKPDNFIYENVITPVVENVITHET